jgi:hypothetical protein
MKGNKAAKIHNMAIKGHACEKFWDYGILSLPQNRIRIGT